MMGHTQRNLAFLGITWMPEFLPKSSSIVPHCRFLKNQKHENLPPVSFSASPTFLLSSLRLPVLPFLFFFFNIYLFGCTGSQLLPERSSLPCSMQDLNSLTRDRTRVPCIAKWILNYWAAREVSPSFLSVLLSIILLSFKFLDQPLLQILAQSSLLQVTLFL